jgi:two-component system nitrogen regulation sensor histidine kinase GlnL
MATVRIYRVAELLNTSSQEVMALLKRDHGIEVKSASSTIEEVVGRQFVDRLPRQRNISLPGGDIFAEHLTIAGMKGAAQLLGRRVDTPDALALVGLIGSEVDRLAALVERLINPAPARAFAPVNIHAVLERVRQLAEAEAGWAIKLVRDYDPSLPDVEGDADRLTQALWNLLRNALESGASQVQLRTRAERQVLIGEAVHRLALRVEIADDGRGVPEDLVERLFLPLVSGRADGTGLGLPLAQQVAREHGGSLGYRSRPGHTVFTLLIPVPFAEEVDDDAP